MQYSENLFFSGTTLYRILEKRWVLHLCFWIFYVSQAYLKLSATNPFPLDFQYTLLYLICDVLYIYWLTRIVIPFFLFEKKYLLFILIILISIGLYGFLFGHYINFFERRWENLPLNFHYKFNLWTGSWVTVIALGLKLGRKWFMEQQKMQEVQRLIAETELKQLKDNVNPHFLFNTLNSIYALTLTDNRKASDVVIKLSELMRYMFTTAQNASVSLEKEVDYLTNYISLEQIRLNKEAVIRFEKKGLFSTKNIAPLLLLPFVENAFKHGVETQSQNITVEIDLALQENDLFFQVKNSKPQHNLADKTGTGLSNIKKRLQLLYPEKHELTIKDEKETFLIKLWISL
jgi:two-component system, LytTR family, sensor kinase